MTAIPLILVLLLGSMAASEADRPVLAKPEDLGPALAEAFTDADVFRVCALVDTRAFLVRVLAHGIQEGITSGAPHAYRRQARLMIEAHLIGLATYLDLASIRVGPVVFADEGKTSATVALHLTMEEDPQTEVSSLLHVILTPEGWRIDDLMDPLNGVWQSVDAAFAGLDEGSHVVEPWVQLAQSLPGILAEAYAGQTDSVAKQLERMDDAGFPPSMVQLKHLVQAMAAWVREDAEACEAEVAAVLAMDPSHPTALWAGAQIADRRGDAATALARGIAFLDLMGDGDADLLALVLRTLDAQGRGAEAIARAGRILDANPGSMQAFSHLVAQYEQVGMEMIIARFLASSDRDAAFRMISSALAEGSPELTAVVEAWAGADPKASGVRTWRAERMAKTGEAAAGVDLLLGETVVATMDDEQIGELLGFAGRHKVLGHLCDRIIEDDALLAFLTGERSTWYLGHDHVGSLEPVLERLRQTQATAWRFSLLEGRLLHWRGRHDEAAESFQRLWTGLPEADRTDELKGEMVNVLLAAGDPEAAIRIEPPGGLADVLRPLAVTGDHQLITDLIGKVGEDDQDWATACIWRVAIDILRHDMAEGIRHLGIARTVVNEADDEVGREAIRFLDQLLIEGGGDPMAILAGSADFGEILALGHALERREDWKALLSLMQKHQVRGRSADAWTTGEIARLHARAAEGLDQFDLADSQLRGGIIRAGEDWIRQTLVQARVGLWDRAGRSATIFGTQAPEAAEVLAVLNLRQLAKDWQGHAAVLTAFGALLSESERAWADIQQLRGRGDLVTARAALTERFRTLADERWQTQVALLEVLKAQGELPAFYDLLPEDHQPDLEQVLADVDEQTAAVVVARHAELFPEDPGLIIRHAQVAVRAGEWQRVLDLVLPVLASEPSEWSVHWQSRGMEARARFALGQSIPFADWYHLIWINEAQKPELETVVAKLVPADAWEEAWIDRQVLAAAVTAGDGPRAWKAFDRHRNHLLFVEYPVDIPTLVGVHLLHGLPDEARAIAVLSAVGTAWSMDDEEVYGPDALAFARLAADRGDQVELAGWIGAMISEGREVGELWQDHWIGAALRGPCAELAARWPEPLSGVDP